MYTERQKLVYVCIHGCMYVCMYARVYVCMYTRFYICKYVCMYMHTDIGKSNIHPSIYTCIHHYKLQEQLLRMNGPSGLLVKMLTQIARDVGLSPTWFQIFLSKFQMLRE